MDMLFLKAVMLVPLTLLPILNPVGNAPVFAAAVAGAGGLTEQRVARQVALNCWFLLIGAMFIGSHVLDFFGISLPVVRVGGGLLVASTGWRYLNEQSQDAQKAGNLPVAWTEEVLKTRSFYPISFPLTVGPGSIAAAITLGAAAPAQFLDRLLSFGSSALGLALTAGIIYLFYRYASRIVGMVGKPGTVIVRRMFSFILLCVGIQIAWHGVTDLLLQAGMVAG
jgi:multiple antibiotic resistance protein